MCVPGLGAGHLNLRMQIPFFTKQQVLASCWQILLF
jgi:hypothetical protein